MLNNRSSQAVSARVPGSTYKYPALQNIQAGRGAEVDEDALGRRMVANPMRSNSADKFYPSSGVSQPKGPQAFQNDIFAAQQRVGGAVMGRQDLSSPLGRRDMDALGRRGVQGTQTPGGIGGLSEQDYAQFLPETGGRRPPSARLQALAAVRKGVL